MIRPSLSHFAPSQSAAERSAVRRAQARRRSARAVEAARAARITGRTAWLLEGPGWLWLQPVLDLAALTAAAWIALLWHPDLPAGAWGLIVFPPLVMAPMAARGLYTRRLRVSILDGIPRVVSAVSLGVLLQALVQVYVVREDPGVATLAHLWVVALALVGAGRVAAATGQQLARARMHLGRPTLIVGAGVVGARVARRLLENPAYGLRPVGFLDSDPPPGDRSSDLPVLGGHDDVEWIASLSGARHVVLAFSRYSDQELVVFSQRCADLGLEVSVVPRLFEAVNGRFTYEAIGGMPLLGLRPTRPRGLAFAVKHLLDRVLAAIGLLLLLPMLLLVALAVRASSAGPVLFRQRRVGVDGKTFDLLKFRSMRAPGPEEAFLLKAGRAPGGVEGTDRRTPVGRLLRRTSLDELPQLLNVLRGDMSLIGPRPERPEYVESFSKDLRRYSARHRVRSGITGWAQVHGLRGQSSLDDRVEWDNYYIEHWNFALDAKILALTVLAVFRNAE